MTGVCHKKTELRKDWIVSAIVALVAIIWVSAIAAAQSITLTVFVRETPLEVEWQNRVFEEFMELHPDIKIETVVATSDEYVDKLAALHISGNPPDVWDHGGQVNTYVYNGWLMDLSAFVERDREELDLEDIFPGAWNAYNAGGKVHGLPFISAPSLLWYNVDLFDQAGLALPPTDWDDQSWTLAKARDYAKKITRDRDGDGTPEVWGWSITTDPYLAITYSRAGGGNWFNDETWITGIPERSTFNTPENQATYQTLVDIINQDGTAMTHPWSHWFPGNQGMVYGDGPWLVMGQLDNINFRWGAAPNPWIKGNDSVIYTDIWMVSSKTKHPEAAWELVKFITSKERVESYQTVGNFPPARRSAIEPYLQEMAQASQTHTVDELIQLISGAHKYGKESQDHVLVGEHLYRERLGPVFAAMFANEKSVVESLIQADQAVRSLIEEYREGANPQ